MKHHNTIDNSEALLVQRWRHGVRLIRPDNLPDLASFNQETPPSVKSLFAMPFNVYFLDTKSVIQNMSETTASICGFQSAKDAIGNTARAVSKKESAEFSIQHNNEVMSAASVIMKEEYFLRLDDFAFFDLAIKFPLLNDEEKVIGVFGCSIILDKLAQSLHLLMQTGLLAVTNMDHRYPSYLPYLRVNNNQQDFAFNELGKKLSAITKQYFSKREIECLYYIIQGKSAREAGLRLNLSPRTVEFYITTLKEKLNCRKKSELIEKIINFLNT